MSVVESVLHWVSATYGLQASEFIVPGENTRFIFHRKHRLFIYCSDHPRICQIFIFKNFVPNVQFKLLSKFKIVLARIEPDFRNYAIKCFFYENIKFLYSKYVDSYHKNYIPVSESSFLSKPKLFIPWISIQHFVQF